MFRGRFLGKKERASAINIFSMTNRHNPYGKFIILDRINYAVSSLAKAVPFLSSQFFATRGAGDFFQGL